MFISAERASELMLLLGLNISDTKIIILLLGRPFDAFSFNQSIINNNNNTKKKENKIIETSSR